LIVVGILVALYILYLGSAAFSAGRNEILSVLAISISVFIVSLLHGRHNLKIGSGGVKECGLTKAHVVLVIIAVIFVVGGFVKAYLSCPVGPCDPVSGLLLIVGGVIVGGFFYAISLILLVINKFRG
jgi:hypothetical protein